MSALLNGRSVVGHDRQVPRTTRERVLLDDKDDATYPWPMSEEVKHTRRRGRTRISGKHQVTLPVDALAGAGLKVGDRLRADVSGPGQITLVREDDPLEQFAGALTGVYPEGYLDDLRREWT
jgi:bifunctional DNA-binding transcriptional regulator/antitoxin component of YhaV-PrlF toxin-antitoxin module